MWIKERKAHKRTFQLYKRLKKGKKYQSLISSFGVRAEPITGRNSSKLSSLSNQPFSFLVKYPYFLRKRDVVSVPFVICQQSALCGFHSCLPFRSFFLASFLNIFNEVEGEALTSYHTFVNSPRISAFRIHASYSLLLPGRSTFYSLFSLSSFLFLFLSTTLKNSSVHLELFCHLASSMNTPFISLVLTSAENHKCH